MSTYGSMGGVALGNMERVEGIYTRYEGTETAVTRCQRAAEQRSKQTSSAYKLDEIPIANTSVENLLLTVN